PVSYTNIFLMKTLNLLLLGEATGEKAYSDKGFTQIDQWMEYTRRNGIREFTSPTYYGPDLNSLTAGYRYSRTPRAQSRFEDCLNFFWADIAGSFF
ncbi:hypothetical protein, partial [Enterococcus faecium]|uniref:hypothetical protein n=1 Tax=Enterococcus faecium TaxID=1352 RepID=UPI0034E94B04